jgi:hypothetical protein
MRRTGHNTKFLVHHTNSSARNVEMGHERRFRSHPAMSALPPIATAIATRRAVAKGHKLPPALQQFGGGIPTGNSAIGRHDTGGWQQLPNLGATRIVRPR